MGRASSSKKVARAARTGGGRTYTAKRPYGWYSAMAVVILLGLVILTLSVQDRKASVAASETTEAPFERGSEKKPEGDHWHVAYGVYACDEFLPPLQQAPRDPNGIHTHEDGLIHVEPSTRRAAGENARMSLFEDVMGITLDADRVKYAGETFEEGDDCDGEPGEIRFLVNGKEVKGDPSRYRFADRDVAVVAFARKDKKIPEVPWKSRLDENSAPEMPEGDPADPATPTSSVEGQETPSTDADGQPAPSSTPTTEPSASSPSG